MKSLFISRVKSHNSISTITKNQGESLCKKGIKVDYFTINQKGIIGYLKAVPKIKKILKNNKYDIVHAHYSLSAFAASLAGAKPLIVSLMGSDLKAKSYYRYIIKFFNRFFWSAIIVKSVDMKKSLRIKKALVIPNGVDVEKYVPIGKKEALKITKWDNTKRHILFAANPEHYVKNFKLAKAAFNMLISSDIQLHTLNEIPNEQMPFYFNAADVVLLTSFWEGSPNVIKEAMACNRPIVATDVGDVSWLFGDCEGLFLTSYDIKDVADNIERAIKYAMAEKYTRGRHRIIDLELDSESIAKRLIVMYNKLSKKY